MKTLIEIFIYIYIYIYHMPPSSVPRPLGTETLDDAACTCRPGCKGWFGMGDVGQLSLDWEIFRGIKSTSVLNFLVDNFPR